MFKDLPGSPDSFRNFKFLWKFIWKTKIKSKFKNNSNTIFFHLQTNKYQLGLNIFHLHNLKMFMHLNWGNITFLAYLKDYTYFLGITNIFDTLVRDCPIFHTDLQIWTTFGLCTPWNTILFHCFIKLIYHFTTIFFSLFF